MNILIFAGGDIDDYCFVNQYIDMADYIICADRGINHTRIIDIIPNLIVGDFDSASKEDMIYYKNKNVPFKAYPAKKDKTDTEIALEIAMEKKPKEIWIVGAIGTRLDHTLGNIHLLYLALQKKVSISLVSKYNKVYLIDKSITISGKEKDTVSLIPFTLEVKGVNTEGLYYKLKEAVLYGGSTYGISNVMTSTKASIKIKSGLLLVIQAEEK